MKFLVLDIETTGVDSENNQIIELGAVVEDTSKKLPIHQLPSFKNIVKHPSYNGSAYAINMNRRIFEILAKAEGIRDAKIRDEFELENGIYDVDSAVKNLARFIQNHYYENGKHQIINIAGKNFGVFDKLFLDKVQSWNKYIKYERRFIDPAILFVDWNTDERLPSLDQCLERAEINRQVTHNAVEDCIDTLLCLRAKY